MEVLTCCHYWGELRKVQRRKSSGLRCSCRYSTTLTVCMDPRMQVQRDWDRVSRGCNTSKYKVMPTGLHTASIFIFIVYRKPSSRFSTASVSASDTHSSMALFHMMTYPDKMKDSMLTMCVFPRSVPTYSHLLWKGRWQNVILQSEERRRKTGWASAKQRFVPSLDQTHNHTGQ